MKALTIYQPFASMIALGAKRIETRSWYTSYRGPLAIHAAKAFPEEYRDLCADEPFRSVLGLWDIMASDLPRGCVVAVTTLADCKPTSTDYTRICQWVACLSVAERAFGDFSARRHGWVLRNTHALIEPIPCRGAQGLWECDDERVACGEALK